MEESVIPADYDELFRRYYGTIVHYVIKGHIPLDRAHDVASEILASLMAKDILGSFRPDYVSEYRGQMRPARFETFLIAVVTTYVRGHRDKGHRFARREMLTWGTEGDYSVLNVGDWQLDPGSQPWAYRMMVKQVREHLATIPPTSPKDRCDLVRLFDLIVRQVEETGRKDITELMSVFGISRSAMWNWLGRLRVEMAVVLNPA